MSLFNKKEIEEKDELIKKQNERIKDLEQVNLLLNDTIKDQDLFINQVKVSIAHLNEKPEIDFKIEDQMAKIQDNLQMMNMALDISSSSLTGFAKSIERIATGTHETAASITEIARTTESSAKLAQQLVTIAREGSVSSSKTIQSSKDILTTYTLMDNVVNLIIDIADRIKNLSINIKIEAAHVGQNGKGFSVIADEVTNLSDEAASQIKGIFNIISSMKELVIDGVARAEQTEKAFKQVEQIADQNNNNAMETMSAMQQIDTATNDTSNILNDIANNIACLEKPVEDLKDNKAEVNKLINALSEYTSSENKQFIDSYQIAV